ncbi:MAG: JAB domain-containing protein [Candidatus Limivicinus sp.]
MGIHDGHRERLRQRFTEHGLENFNEVNALELLLFYAIPRRDTNEIAHALLDRFGSLSAVFEAGVQELRDVPGVGESTAVLISLIPQIMRKALILKESGRGAILSSTDAGDYLVPRFMYMTEEHILLLCLNSKKQINACIDVGSGVVNASETSTRKIVETALKYRASSVILAHNHPDGFAIPSREDDMVTKQVCSSLELVGIQLIDHIIVSGEDYVSYADSGLIGRCKY